MIELPEAVVLARQVNQYLSGKTIVRALANQSAHKFAWYTGDPGEYNARLTGKTIGQAEGVATNVEIQAGDKLLVISVPMHLHPAGEKPPAKHQLLLEFDDCATLTCTVQMWGGMLCIDRGQPGMEDYNIAKVRPSPLTDAFSPAYFQTLFDDTTGKMSTKEFLATKQRIPGLGNGVLQDILWHARLHPRRKMQTLSDQELEAMFTSIKTTLQAMVDQGGRDTERDLFWQPGGYRTILSKNTVGAACPACGTMIAKEPFMGGAIYYCEVCQRLN